MNKTLLKDVIKRLAGGMAIGLLTMGVFGSQQALAGISTTKHNLTSSGITGANTFTPTSGGTAEICVFCHTPHGSDTSASVPLWNRKMASPSTYTTYNSLGTSSLDGATATVGSVSLACLSCHDGIQAMNTMINQPGSGGYTADGSGIWAGSWTPNTNGKIGSGTNGAITNIGQDLKNDHPIGIQYAGGPKAATLPAAGSPYGSALFNDPDFNPALSATLNSQQVWWVDSGTVTSSRDKADMLLYTRSTATETGLVLAGGTTGSAGAGVAQPFVECASCHDPHTSANATFLRISNAGSAVCLACHIK